MPSSSDPKYLNLRRFSMPPKGRCMEMDIIEANGDCKMATTIHTFATPGAPHTGNCDRAPMRA